MEQTVVVTFETLYELLRREKSKADLQKVESSVLQQVKDYLKEKHSMYESCSRKNDLFSQKEKEDISLQLINIRRVLREWHDRREQKIVNLALNKSRTNSTIVDATNLLEHEKQLYEQVTQLLTQHRTEHFSALFEAARKIEISSESKDNAGHVKVRFLEPVDAFFGTELEEYGPFKEDEEVTLPPPLAEILVSDGKAELSSAQQKGSELAERSQS